MKTRIEQNEPNDFAAAKQSITQTRPGDPAAGPPSTGWNTFRGFVRRYELVIFFALSYLIAWSTLPFGSFLAFSPLVSAIQLFETSIVPALPATTAAPRLRMMLVRPTVATAPSLTSIPRPWASSFSGASASPTMD